MVDCSPSVQSQRSQGRDICKTCDEGSGLLWDSPHACPDCEKGKAIQYQYDIHQIKGLRKAVRQLNKRIKAYEKGAKSK